MPQGMTPSIIRANKGGGSFANFPFILRDQTLTFLGFGNGDGGFRFFPASSTLSQNGGGFITSVDTVPLQFHNNRPANMPANFSIRYTALFDSNVANFVFDFPAVDVWRTLSTTRAFDMIRPAIGTTEGFTLTIEIAPTADLTDTQALANIRYEWTNNGL